MQIIRAVPEQAEALTGIAHAAKRHWGYPEKWIEGWRAILTICPKVLAASLAYCAVESDRLVGFYLVTNENGKVHLDHLWILPDWMSRGIGRALFDHAIGEARRLGYHSLTIEADPNAEEFYKRMGAIRIGETITNIDDQERTLPILRYDIPEIMT